MNNKDKLINDWLSSCPLPVVARIIDDKQDLLSIAISTPLYEKNTLVVVPIETLYCLVKRQTKEDL